MKDGFGGQIDVNKAPVYNQNDQILVDDANQHNADLCGPVAATHLIGGFGDFKNVSNGSPVQMADGPEAGFASVEHTFADEMGTGSSGTYTSDFNSEFESALKASLWGYGSFNASWQTYYSGSNTSNSTTNSFADPVCQGIWYTYNANSGYDYYKTQFQLQVGFYNINPIKFLGATIGYTYNRVGGHFVPLSAVWPSQAAVAIDNRQEGWPLAWQTFGQETLTILGVSIFNHNALINMPGATAAYSIIEQYNRVTVQHGGTCPAGQYNNGGTCQI